MRSLNLLFGKSSKSSFAQTAWEIWFTTSVLSFCICAMLAMHTSLDIDNITLLLLFSHVVVSSFIGVVTSEDIPEDDIRDPMEGDIIEGVSYEDYINQPDID